MPIDPNDWSDIPSSNSTIDSINITEGCPPGGMNGMGRAIMAGVKTLTNTVNALITTVSGKASASGATFSGTQPIFIAEGAFLHHSSSSNTSGRVHFLPDGSARPASPANGDVVWYYTP